MVLRWMPAQDGLLPPGPDQNGPSPWRCGVVVSTKVHKRAVQRNRLRRQLHQDVLQQLRGSSGSPLWLLISLKPGSATWESPRLLGECRHLLDKAGLSSCPRSPSSQDSRLTKPSSTKAVPPEVT
jgi:ribonuclease P protein component